MPSWAVAQHSYLTFGGLKMPESVRKEEKYTIELTSIPLSCIGFFSFEPSNEEPIRSNLKQDDAKKKKN